MTTVGDVARAIDQVFRDAMRECGQRGGRGLAERHGSGAGELLIDLRTVLIDERRSVAAVDFAELTRYADPLAVARGLDAAEARGMITRDSAGRIHGTARGRAFLTDLYGVQAGVLADYWSPAAVAALAPVLGRLVDAALAGAGEAVAGSTLGATSPPAEPDGTPDTVLLLNRLSTMRYHRSDAHAAAWREAGLTAPEMVALQERGGAARDAIERRTDELAAPAYAEADLPGLIFRLRTILRHHAISEV